MPSDYDITILGKTQYRSQSKAFGIYRADRRAHLYLLGRTGAGKSTLLRSLISQDIVAGEGVIVFDFHGDLVDAVLPLAEKHRPEDTVYFDAADPQLQWGFNPFVAVPEDQHPLAVSAILDGFRALWGGSDGSWGPRLEHILRNCLLALLPFPSATLADALTLLTAKPFQALVLPYIKNPQVRQFWTQEFPNYPIRLRAEAISPIQNKLGCILAYPQLSRILRAQNNSLPLRTLMDRGQILLLNLAKGKLGSDASRFLGVLLLTQIANAGLARADQVLETRRDCYLYLDEFQSLGTESIALMLSELRKFRVNLTLANQYLGQLPLTVRDALLGNVGSLIAFRTGPTDAQLLADEFQPHFGAEDILGLANHHAYVRLMVEGRIMPGFQARV